MVKFIQSLDDISANMDIPYILVDHHRPDKLYIVTHWRDDEMYEDGEIYIPRTAEWLETFITALQNELAAVKEEA